MVVFVSTILLSAAQEGLTALSLSRSLSLPLLDHTEFACFFHCMMLLRRLALQMAWWDASRHPLLCADEDLGLLGCRSSLLDQICSSYTSQSSHIMFAYKHLSLIIGLGNMRIVTWGYSCSLPSTKGWLALSCGGCRDDEEIL